jgi:hypothetical protein
MASSQKDSEGSLRLIGEQYYGIARLRIVILGALFKIVLYRQRDCYRTVGKVRSPIPWVYGVFYTLYYWMILIVIL